MKCIVLVGISAIEAWDLGLCIRALPVEEIDSIEYACNAEELRQFDDVFPQLTRPLHILAPNKSARRQSKRWHCHTLSRKLPRHSFFKVTENIYVAAPYLCFFQFARKLPFAHALLLGMELCGGYSTLRLHREAGRCAPGKDYLERRALSTPAQLQRYIKACGLGKNSVPRRVASLLQAGTASPRESIIHAMIHPSRLQGGFGMEGYEVNGEIQLPREMAIASGVASFRGDFYWREKALILEYDGRDYHADDSQRSYDNFRRTVLGELGIRTICLDKGQFKDLATVEHVMSAVASHLGEEPSETTPRIQKARRLLHRQLLEPDINLYP